MKTPLDCRSSGPQLEPGLPEYDVGVLTARFQRVYVFVLVNVNLEQGSFVSSLK
jgi:hypothetical protein